MTIPFINAEQIASALSYLDATRAIQGALAAGFDPATDPSRMTVPLELGEFLIMPSEASGFAGVKILSVAPGNPAAGFERIQGIYVLLDSETLTPRALLDGSALTSLRTPAVSAAAGDVLAAPEIDHLVVFGSGPQALGHVAAMRAIRSIERVTLVAREPARAASAAGAVGARVGTAADVADAQLIVCATTARKPLFDSSLVRDDACLIAVGSHEPTTRELDSAIMARSLVVVEDRDTALREAGGVVIPVDEGVLVVDELVPMRELFTGAFEIDYSRPRVFTSTGMSWEDLVIAAKVYQQEQ